jgi:hypothetical protein
MSDDAGITIPGKFFDMPLDEFIAIAQRGGLDAMECLRLWKMLGRTDPCPTFLPLMVNAADVKRLFPRPSA